VGSTFTHAVAPPSLSDVDGSSRRCLQRRRFLDAVEGSCSVAIQDSSENEQLASLDGIDGSAALVCGVVEHAHPLRLHLAALRKDPSTSAGRVAVYE